MAENDNVKGPEAGAPERRLSIKKIYIKDISFEAPDSPRRLPSRTETPWKPEYKLQFDGQHRVLEEDGTVESMLTVTITARNNGETVWLCEVHQAGMFNISGFSEAEMGPILGIFCPSTLLPYAREAVAGMVSRGGFPQYQMAPINFDAMYAERMHQAQQEAAAAPAAE